MKKKELKSQIEHFVKNNKLICKMIINKNEYEIHDYIDYGKYDINKNDNLLKIILTEINSCINARYKFNVH